MALQGKQTRRAVGSEVASGRLRRRSELLDEGRRSRELAREQVHRDALAEGKLEITQSSCLTGQTHVPLRERVPPLVVPQVHGHYGRKPPPTSLGGRRHVGTERVLRVSQHRHGSLVAVAEQRDERVDQQVDLARSVRPRRNLYSFCYLQRSSAGSSKASGEPGRYQRLQIRLASHRRIEVSEPSGGFEQQRRGIVAVPRGECDLGTQQIKP